MSGVVIDLCSDDSDVPLDQEDAENDVQYQYTTIDISVDNNNEDTDNSTITLKSMKDDTDDDNDKVPTKRQKLDKTSNNTQGECENGTESEDNKIIAAKMDEPCNSIEEEAVDGTRSEGEKIIETNSDDEHLVVLKEERYIEQEEGSTASDLSTSNLPVEALRLMDEFFTKCQQIIGGAEIEKKVKIIKSKAKKASEYLNTDEFLETFQRIINVESKSKKLAKALFTLNNLLISHVNVDHIEDNSQLEQLYEKLHRIQGKIEQYATADVEFEDEGNSAYMKFEKYKERAAVIVKYIRKLERKPIHSGMPYYLPLEFNSSKYPEFNAALTKKYKSRDRHNFPSLYEVDKCLRKCAKLHGFAVAETEMVLEVNKCFTILGKCLKRRRQDDLGFLHFGYIEGADDDPAENDPSLEMKLRDNMKSHTIRRDKIFDDFATKEEMGVEPELSSDSDDSKIDGYDSSD